MENPIIIEKRTENGYNCRLRLNNDTVILDNWTGLHPFIQEELEMFIEMYNEAKLQQLGNTNAFPFHDETMKQLNEL